jgi:prolyl 4-hydroxylase
MKIEIEKVKAKLYELSKNSEKKILTKFFEFSLEKMQDEPISVFDEIYSYLQSYEDKIEDFSLESYIHPETFKVILMVKILPIEEIRKHLLMSHWEKISNLNLEAMQISLEIDKITNEQLKREDSPLIRRELSKIIEKVLSSKKKKEIKVFDISIEEPLELKKIVHSENPLIYTVENFLSDSECQAIMEISEGKLERSKVVSTTNEFDFCEDRTSSGVHIPHNATSESLRIVRKIARAVGISLEQAEDLQVVHYSENQFYDYHYDTFDEIVETKYLIDGGQRILTAIVYLNNVIEGGETGFRNLDLKVPPKKGSLLVFETVVAGTNYRHEDSIHSGLPVIKGEKFAFNLWFRERKRENYHKLCNYVVEENNKNYTLLDFLKMSS